MQQKYRHSLSFIITVNYIMPNTPIISQNSPHPQVLGLKEVGINELGELVEPSVPLVHAGRAGAVVVQHVALLVADLPERVQRSLLVFWYSTFVVKWEVK